VLEFKSPRFKVVTLGSGVMVALRTLDPLIQVRILAPQPESDDCGPNLCVY
jgi:hypothetical protein